MTQDQDECDRIIAESTEKLNTCPGDVTSLINRGRAWYRKKDYFQALVDFDEALAGDADRVDARYVRGLALSKKGQHSLAIMDFTEAISRGLEERCLPHCYYNRGRCHYLEKAYDDAVDDFNEAIRLDLQHARAYMMRGLVWQHLGDYHKSIADYDLAIRYDHSSPEAYHNRGNAWVYLGKLQKGIADFTRAIHLDPEDATTHNSRGIAWKRKGLYAKALADFERALELAPRSAQQRAVLAEFLATCPKSRFRDGDRALKLITEACELTETPTAEYIGCVASAYAARGDFSSATEFQKKALDLATEQEDRELMRLYIESYEAGVLCLEKPPSWRDWWA